MNTKLHLLTLLLIPAFLTSCPEQGGSNKTALRLVVCQPERQETISALMISLRQALIENNHAGSADLEVRVITSENEIITIPAPTVEGIMVEVFGPSTPYALKKQLEAHLATVQEHLQAGCPAKPMNPATLKSAPLALFDAEDFVVWSLQGDSKSLWAGAETAPKAVIKEAKGLATVLDKASTRNLLVLSDPVKTPALSTAKKPAKKTPGTAKVNTDLATVPEPAPPHAALPVAAQGSTVVLNVGAPIREASGPSLPKSSPSIDFDPAAEHFGTILHDPGMSAPKDKQQVISAAVRLLALREDYDFQVVIISRADKLQGSTKDRNQQLSEQRARICKALLIEQGVPVHDHIFIGDDAAEGISERDRGTQIHLINKKLRDKAKVAETANR